MRCKNPGCGSYAFNLYKDGIDQGELCDVHYWQGKAEQLAILYFVQIFWSRNWPGEWAEIEQAIKEKLN